MPILCSGFFGDNEAIEEMLKILEVGHIATSSDDSEIANGVQTLYAFETCQRAIRSFNGTVNKRGTRIDMRSNVPRVSAAIIIPSLNLIARTDVPVTMGCLHRESDLEIQI